MKLSKLIPALVGGALIFGAAGQAAAAPGTTPGQPVTPQVKKEVTVAFEQFIRTNAAGDVKGHLASMCKETRLSREKDPIWGNELTTRIIPQAITATTGGWKVREVSNVRNKRPDWVSFDYTIYLKNIPTSVYKSSATVTAKHEDGKWLICEDQNASR